MLAPESKAFVSSHCCVHSAQHTFCHTAGAPYLLDESRWKVRASLFGIGSLNHNPQAMYASLGLMPPPVTCGLLTNIDLVPLGQVSPDVLQMTRSRLEAASEPWISVYGPATLALLKCWEMSGDLWDSPQWTLEAGPYSA